MSGRPKGSKGRKSKTDIIDVGERPSDTDGDDAERDDDGKEEDGLDHDLVQAATVETDEPQEESEEPEPRSSGSLARRDPLAAYMSETRRYPLLTPEEEHALAVRLVEQHDTGAARKLVEANLRLVV